MVPGNGYEPEIRPMRRQIPENVLQLDMVNGMQIEVLPCKYLRSHRCRFWEVKHTAGGLLMLKP